MQGEDGEFKIRSSFLRVASGFLLVLDLTRHETLVTAFSIQKMVEREVGNLPFLALFNKNDLTEQIEITDSELQIVTEEGWKILRTSAKSGEQVEEAFSQLAKDMLETQKAD